MAQGQLELLDVGFFKALMHDDDLGAIVRGQTFIENRLQTLVSRNLRHPKFYSMGSRLLDFRAIKRASDGHGRAFRNRRQCH